MNTICYNEIKLVPYINVKNILRAKQNIKLFVYTMPLCAPVYMPLWSPAGKGLTSWLTFVVSNGELVTFPLVSWVRCGT